MAGVLWNMGQRYMGFRYDHKCINSLRIWTHDNFGEDLLLNPRDGAIYYWDKSRGGLTARAVELNTTNFVNSLEPPIFAKQIMVSDADRHVIAFGTNPVFETEQDPLLIRFSSSESFTDWLPVAENTAGGI